MIKGTPELLAERREEIVNVCEKLYKTMSFKEITLKEIGKAAPFSRPTIYNYFQSKEEIFLALFEKEYDRWSDALAAILNGHDVLSPEELAGAIAESLANREQLLKLLSMNNYDMEANSRLERLTSFKRAYGKSIQLLRELLKKFCPETTDAEIQNIVYVFLPFMFGVYPYAAVTEKQKAAMKEAGVEFVSRSIYDITYDCLIRLLRSRRRSEKEMK